MSIVARLSGDVADLLRRLGLSGQGIASTLFHNWLSSMALDNSSLDLELVS